MATLAQYYTDYNPESMMADGQLFDAFSESDQFQHLQDIDHTDQTIDDLIQSVGHIDVIGDQLMAHQPSYQSVNMAQLAVEQIFQSIQIQPPELSVESFSTRRSLQLSMEDTFSKIKDKLKEIYDKIYRFIMDLWEKLVDFFSKAMDKSVKTLDRAKGLLAQVQALSSERNDKKVATGGWAKNLMTTPGKLVSSEIIKAAERMEKEAEALKDRIKGAKESLLDNIEKHIADNHSDTESGTYVLELAIGKKEATKAKTTSTGTSSSTVYSTTEPYPGLKLIRAEVIFPRNGKVQFKFDLTNSTNKPDLNKIASVPVLKKDEMAKLLESTINSMGIIADSREFKTDLNDIVKKSEGDLKALKRELDASKNSKGDDAKEETAQIQARLNLATIPVKIIKMVIKVQFGLNVNFNSAVCTFCEKSIAQHQIRKGKSRNDPAAAGDAPAEGGTPAEGGQAEGADTAKNPEADSDNAAASLGEGEDGAAAEPQAAPEPSPEPAGKGKSGKGSKPPKKKSVVDKIKDLF